MKIRPGLTCLLVLLETAVVAARGLASEPTGRQSPPQDSSFACSLTAPVGSLLVQPDGMIVMAGGGMIRFVTENGLGTLNGTVTRFHPTGAIDHDFGCRADPPNYVNVAETHLAQRSDGRFLMAGSFHTVDDQPRSRLALLSPDGRLDSGFIPWSGGTEQVAAARPFSPSAFFPAALDAAGCVVVPVIKRNPRSAELRVFRMDEVGCLSPVFPSDPPGIELPDTPLLLLTESGFWLFRPVDWQRAEPTAWSTNPPRAKGLRDFLTSGPPLSAGDAARVLRNLFEQVPLELCRNAIRLPDGGAILLVQDGDAGRFMRFGKDWLPDLSYTNSLRARGYLSLALQADGKLLVGRGSELRDLASPKALSVVRVNADGSIDHSFKCETDERVVCLAVQPDAKIVLGGYFQQVNGTPARWLARVNSDGSLDEAFQMHFQSPAALMAGKRLAITRLPPDARTTATSSLATGAPTRTIIITSLTVQNGVAVLSFTGDPNREYHLEARNALKGDSWDRVAIARTDAAGSGTLRDPEAARHASRFYRVAAIW